MLAIACYFAQTDSSMLTNQLTAACLSPPFSWCTTVLGTKTEGGRRNCPHQLVPFTTSYSGNTNNYKLFLSTSLTCDGRVAPGTLFSVQAAETLDAVWSLSLRGEGLTSQRSFAPGAQKALFVPHLVLVGHPSFSQWLWDTHQTILVISYQHQVLMFSSGISVADSWKNTHIRVNKHFWCLLIGCFCWKGCKNIYMNL